MGVRRRAILWGGQVRRGDRHALGDDIKIRPAPTCSRCASQRWRLSREAKPVLEALRDTGQAKQGSTFWRIKAARRRSGNARISSPLARREGGLASRWSML